MKSLGAIALAAALATVAPFASAQAAPTSIARLAATGEATIQVHGFHCEPEWSPRYGWHRHWAACQRLYPQYHRGHDYWLDRRYYHNRYGAPRWY
jgi:hypothetical protein